MRIRPLEKLPTIRGKLGSVIVLAVAMTIAGIYVLLGLALRNSFRDADLVELLRIAQARSADVGVAVEGTSVAQLRGGTFSWTGPPLATPPPFDGGVHVGVLDGIEYAAVPLRDGSGGMLYAVREEPGFLGRFSRPASSSGSGGSCSRPAWPRRPSRCSSRAGSREV